MNFTTMSIEKLGEFLRGRKLPGTGLAFPEEVVTKLRDNYIDGATLLILMEDLAELREIIPNTAHRLQLKRIISNAQKDSVNIEVDNVKASDAQLLSDEEDMVMLSPVKSNFRHPLSPLNNPTVNDSDNQSLIATTVKPCQTSTPVAAKPSIEDDDTSPGLPFELPTPDRFSIRVEEAISHNELLTARLQLIKDAGNFYYGLCRHPKQGDYKRMAKKLCERFPELKDVHGDRYWMSVQKQLSMFFRNQRRLSKMPKGKENDHHNLATSSTAKKVKLDDDVHAAKRNLDMLRKMKKSDFSKGTFNRLLEETYNRRRQFIRHDAESVQSILEQCPYLEDPEQIKQELARIIGTEKVAKASTRILGGLQAAIKISGELSNKQIVESVNEIQRRTKKKAVPAKLISFHDPSTPVEKMFSSKMVEFRIVCRGTDIDVEQIFICGENNVICECPSTCLVAALFYVIACYYVFDVGYPAALEGVLLFIQDVGLLCVDSNGCRYSKYNSFLAEVKDYCDKNSAL